MDDNNKMVPYECKQYAKSNILISAKYKSSIYENKIMALGLYKLNNKQYIEDDGSMVVNINVSELNSPLVKDRRKSGSYYKVLAQACELMTGRTIGYMDPENDYFDFVAIVNRATYDKGTIRLKFNNDIKDYLVNLKENFSLLDIPTVLSFEEDYSFRLYEVLKSKAFYPKGISGEKIFNITYNLSELKLDLGIVNSNIDSVKRKLKGSKAPDYDKIVESAPEQQFRKWSDFKKKVLDVAVSEISEKTDMKVSYQTLTKGRGGKVYAIIFTVDIRDEDIVDAQESNIDIDLDDLADELRERIEEKISTKDAKNLLTTANNDINKVMKAYEIAKESGCDNLIGFMIAAIKNGYDKPKTLKKKINHGFEGRSYTETDFESLYDN